MTEDLNTRLEHAAKGITPQTCPDERRRYLGSLRERVLVRMTVKETDNPDLDALFLDHLNLQSYFFFLFIIKYYILSVASGKEENKKVFPKEERLFVMKQKILKLLVVPFNDKSFINFWFHFVTFWKTY